MKMRKLLFSVAVLGTTAAHADSGNGPTDTNNPWIDSLILLPVLESGPAPTNPNKPR